MLKCFINMIFNCDFIFKILDSGSEYGNYASAGGHGHGHGHGGGGGGGHGHGHG